MVSFIFNIAIITILLLYIVTKKRVKKEAFDSQENCLKQGYPNDFCLHVPMSFY
jgi:hypothetical protein